MTTDKETARTRWDWTQVAVMLTALATVGALYFSTHQTSQALRATRDQIELSEQGQLTDRFSKAVEQLGSQDSLEVRLGGIYALERIARDSARDHPTIMEVLSAYLREHAPLLPVCAVTTPSAHPATDVQAILTVLGRRYTKRNRDELALNDICLRGAHLTYADLAGADLTNVDLRGADLTGTFLTHTHLTGAFLTGADLTGADLTGADLTGADLTGAFLRRADVTGADVTGADLTGADLTGADLTGADLTGADLTGTFGLR